MKKYMVTFIVLWTMVEAMAGEPETVSFLSRDGKTSLIGYLFTPEGAGPHPGVVMLHGRAGAYAAKVTTFSAKTLSERHKMWGEFWAKEGYSALLVDSFTPRGFPKGFSKGSYKDRPKTVSDQLVRPLDAYGALGFLRQMTDKPIGLQGWSNGGMTVLASLTSKRKGGSAIPTSGFGAALALYPGCIPQTKQPGYKPYAPLFIFVASLDDEVSPKACKELVGRIGGEIQLISYEGAQHAYDLLPIKTIPNLNATKDSFDNAKAFFGRHLK
ncbi:MAG: dienelactone hydrolase family protein [Gammaproteobacteria bacterium]|nr:dienelactone hydrolase family protein [Gammaproteobacteria bacterium]